MRTVVTGAAGFIGFHMVQKLSGAGHDVLAVDSFENNYSVDLKLARWHELRRSAEYRGEVRQLRLDLCDDAMFSKVVRRFAPDVILHFAARPGVREGASAWPLYARSNFVGLSSVLSTASEAKPSPKLIYASSSSVYGGSRHSQSKEEDAIRPISFYGVTKAAGEQLVGIASKSQGLTAVGLRMFSVYGPWGRPDMLPWRLVRAAQTGQSLFLYGDGQARRDFTYIDDVVETTVRLIDYILGKEAGFHEIFNVGGGQSISVLDAISEVENVTGRKIDVQRLDRNASDALETLACVSKLASCIGFSPSTSFETGIGMLVPWFESHFRSEMPHEWDS